MTENGVCFMKTDIRGILFDNTDIGTAVNTAVSALSADSVSYIVTPNAEIAQHCVDDRFFLEIVNGARLVLPDGSGVLLAGKLLRTPFKEKIAGVEFGERILSSCAEKGIPVFFLGGKPGIAEKAEERMTEKYKGLDIRGTNDGYYLKSGITDAEIISKINASGARVLFLCLGSPMQEYWISRNYNLLSSPMLVLCLGGSLDIYSGTVKRAPKLFISLHAEWLWRLIKEPRRIKRFAALPKFAFGTARYAIKSNKKELR